MKIKFLILILLLTTKVYAFNYSNYKIYSIESLIEYIEETSDLSLSGLIYYNEPIVFPLKVKSYPTYENDKDYIRRGAEPIWN